MIQANELRLNNWIFINDLTDTIAEVICLSNDGITAQNNDAIFVFEQFEDISPIPLTPEILEKCGFENNTIGHHDTAFILTPDWREQPSFHIYIEYTDSPFPQDKGTGYPIAHELKYLHQLQNLYFALTGNELTINL